ncbi:hypothetical protein [Frondihabitans sp. VKM Ac-2883]|uniref:hypothetical protein n=1 Tax=Frondihabitans sp. VKM Ac-2883 TaxID=2783823 RepID=UPI00188C577A|nr:hypothetical protein [Frondihabitans sp. VKM Ac-2883]MBF4577555.1 hypothetical protein [Frondihabitans sp. VKM Ac-2883]
MTVTRVEVYTVFVVEEERMLDEIVRGAGEASASAVYGTSNAGMFAAAGDLALSADVHTLCWPSSKQVQAVAGVPLWGVSPGGKVVVT